MFYALACVLCLAVLFIVQTGATILSSLGLWSGRRFLHLLPAGDRANLLFLLRALPFFLASIAALGFALPAFLRFEPRSSNEILGWKLLSLAALGGLVTAAVLVRSLWIVRATQRAQKQWHSRSWVFEMSGVDVPVFCVDGPAPLLAVTGWLRPRIFVAQTVIEELSPAELFAAIAHELAHVSAWDNLKQLFLKTTAFRLVRHSDASWLNASEMAADEGALANGASALDLSSALVKVGGLSRQASAGNLIAVSHLLPANAQSCLEMRVRHLRKLLESEDQAPRSKSRSYWPVWAVAGVALCYAMCVGTVLPWIHEMLELLVK